MKQWPQGQKGKDRFQRCLGDIIHRIWRSAWIGGQHKGKGLVKDDFKNFTSGKQKIQEEEEFWRGNCVFELGHVSLSYLLDIHIVDSFT